MKLKTKYQPSVIYYTSYDWVARKIKQLENNGFVVEYQEVLNNFWGYRVTVTNARRGKNTDLANNILQSNSIK